MIAGSCASRPVPGTDEPTSQHERRTMSTLEDWTGALCAELGLDPAEATQKTVLNLARVVAHTVDRPAAPLTAYLLGLAVGRGQPLAGTAERLQDIARGRAGTDPG